MHLRSQSSETTRLVVSEQRATFYNLLTDHAPPDIVRTRNQAKRENIETARAQGKGKEV